MASVKYSNQQSQADLLTQKSIDLQQEVVYLAEKLQSIQTPKKMNKSAQIEIEDYKSMRSAACGSDRIQNDEE